MLQLLMENGYSAEDALVYRAMNPPMGLSDLEQIVFEVEQAEDMSC